MDMNKKIYIWGTGRLAGKVVGKHVCLEKISGFIDNNINGSKEYMGKPVFLPTELPDDYDAILVANLFGKEIYEQCKNIKIDLSKVIFCYNNCVLDDMNKNYLFVQEIVGQEYAQIIKNRYHCVRGVETEKALCLEKYKIENKTYMETDYVRIKSFELVVKEIYKRKLKGAVAEFGVFRGEFAQYINYAFPNKKLYLFDTFEGFNAQEALNEKKKGNCTEAFIEAYKQTNLDMVLNKLSYLENVIIKQGFFPDSLQGLDETFSFVSLDVDFEESIFEGLKYFYPRLEKGGYIFVHDYNSDLYGVERAVNRYEVEMGMLLSKVPICDANGTLVITK